MEVHAETERNDRRLQQKFRKSAAVCRVRVLQRKPKNDSRAKCNRGRDESRGAEDQEQKENGFRVHSEEELIRDELVYDSRAHDRVLRKQEEESNVRHSGEPGSGSGNSAPSCCGQRKTAQIRLRLPRLREL